MSHWEYGERKVTEDVSEVKALVATLIELDVPVATLADTRGTKRVEIQRRSRALFVFIYGPNGNLMRRVEIPNSVLEVLKDTLCAGGEDYKI